MNYLKKINKIFLLKKIAIKGLMMALLLVIIDKFDIFYLIINKIGLFAFCIILLILFVELVSSVGIKHIFDKNINLFDNLLLINIITFSCYFFYSYNFEYRDYKMLVCLFSVGISLIVILIKMLINKKKEDNYKSNILDLDKIINSEKKINISSKEKYYIDDSEVDYDIINRTNTINYLYTTIINCRPLKSFTIGLQGKWGIGKTTLINNVLRLIEKNNKSNDYLIIKFDPWKYDNEKSMLDGFIKTLLNSAGYDLDAKETMELVKNILCCVFENSKNNIIDYIFKKNNELYEDKRLDEIINNYLITNQKQLILIIDNLDRIDSHKAAFLIKCLASIINFKRTINILLYDEKIVNKILSQTFNSDNNYMAKIVQLRINVPEINDDNLNELKNKIFDKLIIDNVNLAKTIKDIYLSFDDIRQLKIFINEIITYPYENFDLNLKDDLCLKYIKVRSPKLYYEIWNNKKFFISYDLGYDLINDFNITKLENDRKNYFDNISKEYYGFDELLGDLFPRYNNYSKGYSLDNDDYIMSRKNKNISNARYFDLYFTRDNNDYTKINACANKFIEKLNTKRYYNAGIYLDNLFEAYNIDGILLFIEALQLNEKEIKDEALFNLIVILLNEYDIYADRPSLLDSVGKVSSLIADVLLRCDEDVIKDLYLYYSQKYNKLYAFETIQYWIDRNKKSGKKYAMDLSDFINDMCSRIIGNNINIFDKSNYYKNNVWVLYRFCESDVSKLEKYLKATVNVDNIFRFLSSLISTSISEDNSYGYLIAKENLERLNYVNIDKLLKKHGKPKNEKEELILKIYIHSIQTKDPFNYYRFDKYILF